jgi:Ty3 transposon capsid-like protein
LVLITDRKASEFQIVTTSNEPNEPNDTNEPGEPNDTNKPNKPNKPAGPNKPNKPNKPTCGLSEPLELTPVDQPPEKSPLRSPSSETSATTSISTGSLTISVLGDTPEPDRTPQPSRGPALKIPKPKEFDGTDTSLSTVTNWAYNVAEYMDLSEVPADRQTRYAGAFLTGEAKTWFRNNFPDTRNLPALDDFLDDFKEQFLAAPDDDDLLQRLETIQQGERPLAQYTTEIELLILQLGSKDPRLGKRHYLRGLHHKIREGMIAALTGRETLKDLIKRANVVTRNLELAKILE